MAARERMTTRAGLNTVFVPPGPAGMLPNNNTVGVSSAAQRS
jgi:hypothetical protein